MHENFLEFKEKAQKDMGGKPEPLRKKEEIDNFPHFNLKIAGGQYFTQKGNTIIRSTGNGLWKTVVGSTPI